MRGKEEDRIEKDHEFPWIELNWSKLTMRCTRCREENSMDSSWINFLDKHEHCKEDYILRVRISNFKTK